MNDNTLALISAIGEAGRAFPSAPDLHLIEPFQHFYDASGQIKREEIDFQDGALTRREALARFLLLNAVLDQGPDIIGVRKMLIQVTNELYRREIRFLHKPVMFFQELGIAIDEILKQHSSVRAVRAATWASENRSNANRYNLFMDNSRQVLGYAVFRWGVPLALPLLLEQENTDHPSSTKLLDYLESYASTEKMTAQIKDHPRYGLGKAIGDKAAHLFGKWLTSSLGIARRSSKAWGPFSYEVPYDSNAGRVLWRTGYLLQWASEEMYRRANVLQPGAGKSGKTYIRVTNIRGLKANVPLSDDLREQYNEICTLHLQTHRISPKNVEIQRIQHAYLLHKFEETQLTVAHFDDGLIYIGTQFCYNHEAPRCTECPIRVHCEGFQKNHRLIDEYRT